MEPATTTHERSRELADLRRRAYGPDADIQRDPDAMRRLHELEELARSPDAAVPSADEAAAGPASVIASAAAADPDAPPPVHRKNAIGSAVGGGEAGSCGLSPWPCLVLAVAGTGAALVLSVGAKPDGGPDLTLAVVKDGIDLGSDWAESIYNWGVEPGSIVKYEPYDSIGVWAGHTSTAGRCVLLSFHDRIFTAACATNGLDPVLDLYADDQWPVQLEEPLLPGGVIRFIARPTGVDVWVRPGTLSLPGFGE